MNKGWEQHKLGEVVSVFDGTHQTPNYKTKGIMFLSVENINTLLSNKYISENEYRQRFKIKPQYLDVFMTRIGTIGKTNVITTHKPIAYYVSLALLRPQNIQSFFLSFIIQTSKVQQDIWKRTLQIAFPQKINKDEIGKVTLALPLQKEQIDIEKLLLKLDKLITLQQRKLEQLKQLKKAMLQQLFVNKNNKQPNLRFKNFNGDWEERKLSDIANYRNGKAHEQYIDMNGIYTVVNSKFISTNGKVKKFSNEPIELLKKGEIAFVLSDVPNGKALAKAYLIDSDNKYSLNQRIAGISPSSDINSYFLYVLMNRNRYFLKFDDGVGQTNLSKKDIEEFKENYPLFDEQQKIANLFSQIQTLISLQQNKHTQLIALKKYLLQKLFI
ncbi:restriction endonuclease subunit S [Limosilactobacillus reuteri]|uniref:Restriction endonuclease subunit S n=1 Tax=Limosilactobacillus reuteri TaxID=1598 RepID=A0AAJ1IBD3_LIMRT|nr:restriction endonuclease subunit S [Limosilactobacillus reuteri]MDC6078050.1 restriction endonuclease subunit S [Limosilactobacillus reuteri]MDV8947405.1 restriction endonuclease subunit S [Limosilactobacillus reuteri]